MQGALELSVDADPGRLAVLAAGDFDGKIRIVGGRRENLVHLTQTLAKTAREVREFEQRVVMLFLTGNTMCQLVTYRTLEIVLGPLPRIALVAQIALSDHQQVGLTVLADAYQRAQQRRNVLEAGMGQECAHFQLGVRPGADFADQLEHQAAADHHRTVRLLGRQVAHFRLSVQAEGCQLRTLLETQLAVGTGYDRIRLHALNHCADESFEGKCIRDQPDIAIATHSGERQLLRQCTADVVFSQQAERQLIAIGLPACGDFYFAEQHRIRFFAEAHGVGNADLLDRLVLAREPAPFGQVDRQRGVFHGAAQWLFEQLFQTLLEHQSREVRHALRGFNVPTGHLILRSQ